jgi:hypothetical protein
MKVTGKSVCIVLAGLAMMVLSAPAAYSYKWESLVGLRQSDFKRLAVNGFGDSANSYAWSVTCFDGDLIVGTNRHHMWSLMQQMGDLVPGLGDLFMPPASQTWGDEVWADEFRGKIWRYDNGEWSCIHTSDVLYGQLPIAPNPLLPPPPEVEGYYPEAYGYRTLAVYDGAIFALGIGTWVPNMPWISVLRSYDGQTWENITGSLEGATNPRGLLEWNGELFLSASLPGSAPAGAGLGVVYRFNPCADGYWEQVSEPGLGNPDNVEIPYLAEYNGCLYASTVNFNTGFEVWKTDGTCLENGMLLWTCVLKEGFGDTYNQWGMTMQAFGKHLYIGTAAGGGMVLKNGQPVGIRAFDVIRLDKNDNAQLIVGAYKPTDPLPGWPESRVPLSLWPAGFGNPLNVYVWHMCVHNKWLYLGTFDETSILLMAAESLLSQPDVDISALGDDSPLAQLRARLDDLNQGALNSQQRSVIKRLKGAIDSGNTSVISSLIRFMLKAFGGADLWKTRDGIHWVPVTINGFNNPNNMGFRRLVSVQKGENKGLVVGTANSHTDDPRGGCEILIGR